LEITEIRLTLMGEDKLKAFANVTFDNEFVVRDLRIISGKSRFFVSMPNRLRKDGTHQDIAHPITGQMRQKIEDAVLNEYTRLQSVPVLNGE